MNWIELLVIALAGMAGGLVNALAGGGTLITFPILIKPGLVGEPSQLYIIPPGVLFEQAGKKDSAHELD